MKSRPASAAFDAAFPPAPVQEVHWTQDKEAQKKFFNWANSTYALSTHVVLEILNVKAITLYEGAKQDALNAVKAYVAARQKEAS